MKIVDCVLWIPQPYRDAGSAKKSNRWIIQEHHKLNFIYLYCRRVKTNLRE